MNDIEKVKSEDWHIITVFKHLNVEEKELNYYYYHHVVDGSHSFIELLDLLENRKFIDLEDIVAISREKFFTKENVRWTRDLYPLPNPLWIDKEKK